MVWTLLFELNLKKIMKKQITYLFIYLIFLTTLQGQIVQERLPGAEEISNRRTSFNLDEIKVRWKKAALENCTGVPCVPNTVPGPPTSLVATAGNASASVAFVAPTNNGGSVITGYTVTSSPGGITATGATSPINVTGLTNGTAYTFTVAATYAIGNISVASSASTAVTPLAPVPVCPTSTVTDVDNNIYNTVAIGTQCWTTSNLKVTKYNDGTAILLDASGGADGFTGGENWSTQLSGAYTVYGNAPINATNYGYLYNWYAVSDLRKLCPTGWHVPTRNEWDALESQLGGSSNAGGKMKLISTLWVSTFPVVPGDNSSGFSGLPGGVRAGDGGLNHGEFNYGGERGYFWSATSSVPGYAYARVLNAPNTSFNVDSFSRLAEGQSVRCLKD